MSRDEYEVEEGKEVVNRTIVGGRPLSRHKKKLRIPIGLEKTLFLAAVDDVFRGRLLQDRQEAVRAVGYELGESEAHMLDSLPQTTLQSMIAAIDVKKHSRRRFMRNVAASVLAGTMLVESTGCPVCTGSEPDPVDTLDGADDGSDDADDVNDETGAIDSTDISDTPESDGVPDHEVVELDEDMAVTGIMPDEY